MTSDGFKQFVSLWHADPMARPSISEVIVWLDNFTGFENINVKSDEIMLSPKITTISYTDDGDHGGDIELSYDENTILVSLRRRHTNVETRFNNNEENKSLIPGVYLAPGLINNDHERQNSLGTLVYDDNV